MIRRAILGLAVALVWPALAMAQDAAVAPLPRVALETSAGRIVIEVETGKAPITAANFLRYVDEHRLDGTTFYRAMQAGPGTGLVQGGVNNDPDRILPPIAHEPTTQTGLSHIDGAVAMARYAPGTATGDFFVSVGPTPSYDAGRPFSVDPDGFAVFGRVVEGMEIVRAILAAPTSPTEGEGFMRGQMLDPKIVISRAARATEP
ncbi:peptidylprolyl isomerase [Brevundimonas subvibrioides]|uniref:peptidylprolyl isomerase n=1 Tax=Brevundimonas subvibrioides (strain ATCC 15264 / DSM 4735 / LMG 14903 / NBRC 16000 / CB 81) TaxID=633149 RepID=D9QHL8_BRESC|nr:peptidylprolyl isomerase [Brevundimonas subvibrioides]ADL01184.1 peptidyl-prolyl cis-trans isomerase cyclophilin type [Brevundimonas subvibrioides ATCC 15264]